MCVCVWMWCAALARVRDCVRACVAGSLEANLAPRRPIRVTGRHVAMGQERQGEGSWMFLLLTDVSALYDGSLHGSTMQRLARAQD